LGPGPSKRWDRTQSAAFGQAIEKKMAKNCKEKDRPHQKNTSKPKKKKYGLLFYLLLLLLLLYTFQFNDLKASN
jgi:hypothetical protein